LAIILKGINRVNYKKAVIIALAIEGKIPSVVLIKLTDKNFFSRREVQILEKNIQAILVTDYLEPI